MSKWIAGAVAAGAIVAVLAFAAGSDGAPDAKRVGYFKSASRDRVMAYRAEGPVTDEQARAILARAPTTQGRVTMAVLYPPGARAPGAELTTAPGLAAAARLIGTPPFDGWGWRLRINPAGRQTFD